MAKENSNKVKLLKLIELLRQESDEQNPMRGSMVCRRLSEMNISCDRKTLTRDMVHSVRINPEVKRSGYYNHVDYCGTVFVVRYFMFQTTFLGSD